MSALHARAEDPLRPRPGTDIKRLEGTEPSKYRLRVGDLRVVFAVDEAKVYVLELFQRNRGYRLG